MNEAVDCGEGHRGILENGRPLTERMIRRHHQTTPFVAGSDQLEQDGCLSLILPHVAKVVEDQQMVFVELVDRALQRQRLSGLLQALHQIDPSAEQDAVAALDEGMPQSSTKMLRWCMDETRGGMLSVQLAQVAIAGRGA